MTFLAIEKPGISKYCEICNLEFLNEHTLRQSGQYSDLLPTAEGEEKSFEDSLTSNDEVGVKQRDGFSRTDDICKVAESQTANPEGIPQPLASIKAPSLAGILFKRFAVCPYCRGKFIG